MSRILAFFGPHRLSALTLLLLLGNGVDVAASEPTVTQSAGFPDRDEDPFSGSSELDRERLITEVLRRNPTIASAQAAWRAALAEAPQAGSLPDPMLSYSVAPLSIGADVPIGQRVELRQGIPFPGKLKLRSEIALAEAQAAERDVETTRLSLALTASLLFDDYYFVHRSLEINDEHQQLLEEFKRIATARFAAGQGSMQDPIQAEVEQAHLEHREIVLNTTREVLIARMNALLHRESRAPVPFPPAELAVPEEGEAIPDFEPLLRQASEVRPELAATEARVEGGRAAVRLAKREYLPDFALMGSYNSMWRMEEHQWMAGIGVELPLWWGRIRGANDEAKARLARARAERARVADQVAFEVEEALQRLEEAHHVINLYRSRLIPAAGDQVSAARSGFESGRNSFLALIEAERNQRTVKLRFQESIADFHRRRAELNRALGRAPGDPIHTTDSEHEGQQEGEKR